MGLAQKRIVQEYQTAFYPKWKEEFNKVCGFDMPVDVKWDTLMKDDYSDRGQYHEWYEKIYFQCLKEVFASLCADDMGREAVKSGVKKIVIDGTEGYYGSHSMFEDGVFTLKHTYSNVDQIADRVNTWREMIEAKL